MTRRSPTLLLAAILLPLLCSGGCGSSGSPALSPQESAALDALTPDERFFVGRWRVNMAHLVEQVKSGGIKGDAAMAIGLADAMFIDFNADRSVVWTAGREPGGWTLTGGRIELHQIDASKTVSVFKRGETAWLDGGGGQPPLELTKVPIGPALDPAAAAGTWTLDLNASAKSGIAEYKRLTAIVESLTGVSMDQPIPTEEEARRSLQAAVGPQGGTIVLMPGASPVEGSVQMSGKPRDNQLTYEVYKDLVLVKVPKGGPDKTAFMPMPVIDGAMHWKGSGPTMVFRKK